MNKRTLVLLSCLVLILFSACKRKGIENKVIEGIPVDTTQIVIPAQAAQQAMLMKRDALSIVVPVINRLPQAGATYPELVGPNAQNEYTFTFRNARFGEANFTIQFKSPAGTVIDPISNQVSTQSLKSVTIRNTGSSTLFRYSENMVLELETPGDVESTKRVEGIANFNGSGYSLVFRYDNPGVAVNFEGPINGIFTATGTGPTGNPVTLSMTYSTDHSADGTLAWEAFSGGIHIERSGQGTLVTSQARILIQ